MSENQGNVNGKKSFFSVKNVLRILATIGLVGVFCPSFLVSCSGSTMNVNVMTAVGGVTTKSGETVVEPHIGMLICLIIPIAILVLLAMKKKAENVRALIIAICAIVDVIVWTRFKAATERIAEEHYCTFETTPWYTINIVVLVLIAVGALLVLVKVLAFENKSGAAAIGEIGASQRVAIAQTRAIPNAGANTGNQTANAIKFCPECGSKIQGSGKFCGSCGKDISGAAK